MSGTQTRPLNYGYTVEPLYKGHIVVGSLKLVLNMEVSLLWRSNKNCPEYGGFIIMEVKLH